MKTELNPPLPPAAGSYQDEIDGFPRLKKKFQKMTPIQQRKERVLLIRSYLGDRLFGHIAKKELAVLESVMGINKDENQN